MHMLGATVTPITTCPHCSKLVDGSCIVCAEGEQHPSCLDCVDGRVTPPFWRNEAVLAVATAVVVTVISGLIVAKLTAKKRK